MKGDQEADKIYFGYLNSLSSVSAIIFKTKQVITSMHFQKSSLLQATNRPLL